MMIRICYTFVEYRTFYKYHAQYAAKNRRYSCILGTYDHSCRKCHMPYFDLTGVPVWLQFPYKYDA